MTALTVLYGTTSCQPLRAGQLTSFNVVTPESSRAVQPVSSSDVSWSTSNPGVFVAHVTPGFFRFVGAGTAEVRATYQNQFAFLNVPVTPDGFPRLEVSVDGGVLPGTRQPVARAIARPSNTEQQDVTAAVTFTSSDARIASVDGPRITFRPVIGNVVISAVHNGMTGACGIAVYPREY